MQSTELPPLSRMLLATLELIQVIEERYRSPLSSRLLRMGGMFLAIVAFCAGIGMLLSPYPFVVLNWLLAVLPFPPIATEILFFLSPFILLIFAYRTYYFSSNLHVQDLSDEITMLEEELYPQPEFDEENIVSTPNEGSVSEPPRADSSRVIAALEAIGLDIR